MVTETLKRVFSKLKLHSYHEMFKIWRGRETSLTTVETFCMEIIYCLDRPLVGRFADFASLSSANAAEKVNSLIGKGYLRKVRSEKDKRKYYLEPTQKYMDYYNIYTVYIDRLMDKVNNLFEKDELDTFGRVLKKIDELMDDPELTDVKYN